VAVTVRDVAKVAGVSISTVSRALSAPDQVAEATRILVENTARSLGYEPNRAARGLISGRTGNIGLVVPDLENPFFGAVCKGVQARARAAGYAVFIADTEEDPTLEGEVVRGLAKQVDGIILCSARGSDSEVERFASQLPTVLVNRTLKDIPSITFDNGGGLRALMAHLVALGHKRIAYAAGPINSWSNADRTAAFQAVAAELNELEFVELGNFPPYFSGGIQAADLAIASGVTAVAAFNDLMAVGLLDRLRQRGLRAPEDISVTGFDNVPVSTLVWPTITTVDYPRVQMGRASVDLLLEAVLGHPATPRPRSDISFELIVRQSTGVAPVRATDGPGQYPARLTLQSRA